MVIDLIVILTIAFLMTLIFSIAFKSTGMRHGVFFTFLVMFGSTWLGALWVRPIGPAIGNIYLIPVAFLPVLFGLLILAYHDSHRNLSDLDKFEITREAAGFLGVFFWVFLLVMAFPIFAIYLF